VTNGLNRPWMSACQAGSICGGADVVGMAVGAVVGVGRGVENRLHLAANVPSSARTVIHPTATESRLGAVRMFVAHQAPQSAQIEGGRGERSDLDTGLDGG